MSSQYAIGKALTTKVEKRMEKVQRKGTEKKFKEKEGQFNFRAKLKHKKSRTFFFMYCIIYSINSNVLCENKEVEKWQNQLKISLNFFKNIFYYQNTNGKLCFNRVPNNKFILIRNTIPRKMFYNMN